MHLRFLQSLVEVSAEKNHTVVLPIPVDIVNLVLNKKRPGDVVNVTLFRGGKKMDVQVKLVERPGS